MNQTATNQPNATQRRLPDEVAIEVDVASAELHLHVPDDLGCLQGHFTDMPIVPGVALVGWAEHYARTHLGCGTEVESTERLKFNRLVRPGNTLVLSLDHDAATRIVDFHFRSTADNGDCASGRFRFVTAPTQADL